MTKVEEFAKNRKNEIRCYISYTISKLKGIPVFSFPPFVTCEKGLPCYKKCYAYYHDYCKNKNSHVAYDDNYYTYLNEPDVVWRGIEAACMGSCYFRYFESGDIPDINFLDHMVEIAKRQSHCKTVCFTKRYNIVNEWIQKNGDLPENLHIIFSGWKGLQMSNPFLLPECHLIYKDGSTTAEEHKTSYYCKGNCVECKCNNQNCWVLKKNEQILINEH